MSENNLTVWQRLSKTFGPNSLLKQDYPTFKFDKQELLRTQNRDDFEREKLQAQQTFYLTNQWAKVENNLYSQAIYYEPSRLSSQYDYESMEYTPEISAALDIYAEESTTTNEDGFILQIYSESKRIKSVLADLFNNSLDINTNLPMWTRNTCKYGDNFVYLKLDPEKGVVGVQQLPTIEIERHEVGVTAKISVDITKELDKDKKALHFTWKNKNMEFQSWEIAHFRLLGDDRKLPYGTSMLEKARRIWKQLQDIRFARTINRIQKSMIQELNKIAIVHLFLLGFEDELQNFTLGLSNPSTQADLLKIDVWKEKVLLYKDLVSDPGNGIQPVSSTWAKKHIFGFSDEEIRLDLQQQRIERAVGEELKATPTVITKTGIFDNIDKLYGNTSGATPTAGAETTPGGGEELGGFTPPPAGGESFSEPTEVPAGEEAGALPTEATVTPESTLPNMNILIENNFIRGKTFIDLGHGQESLGEISKELDKLLNS